MKKGPNPYRDGRPPWNRASCNGTYSVALSDRIHHGLDLRMNAVDRSPRSFFILLSPSLPVSKEYFYLMVTGAAVPPSPDSAGLHGRL